MSFSYYLLAKSIIFSQRKTGAEEGRGEKGGRLIIIITAIIIIVIRLPGCTSET